MKIQFEGPAPTVPRLAESRAKFADALRTRPGEWALFGHHKSPNSARQIGYEIRNAMHPQNAAFLPAGAFEVETRTMLGQHRIYVRFVGDAA